MGYAPTALTAGSSDSDFVTELLYNRVYSLMWEQGTRWSMPGGMAGWQPCQWTGPLPNGPDTKFTNMLVPAGECDARGLVVPCTPLGN